MAWVIYSARALDDLDRLTDFLFAQNPDLALGTLDIIEDAMEILERHPLIGRQLSDGLRELIISRGHTGYVALYSFETQHDAILVLAIRHQREAGYQED